MIANLIVRFLLFIIISDSQCLTGFFPTFSVVFHCLETVFTEKGKTKGLGAYAETDFDVFDTDLVEGKQYITLIM